MKHGVAHKYKDAIEEYSKGLEVDPSHGALCAKLHCNRGTALAKLNRNEEALVDFDKAISLNAEYGKRESRIVEKLMVCM